MSVLGEKNRQADLIFG